MSNNELRLSFEFFPPKTEAGQEKLISTRDQLNQLAPDFFSVTYGAGGSTRENTFGVVSGMREAGLAVAPHLSFGGDKQDAILTLLEQYKKIGVDRVVALRGDVPSGVGNSLQLVYANELVAFIRQHFGEHFEIDVAAYPEIHPEARNYQTDIGYLKGKFDAGADSAITQYFFNPDAYFYFVEMCESIGINKPIYPGIMPITNYTNLARFSANCGAEIPRWVRKRLEDFGDDSASITAFGLDLVTELCDTLLENGAPGLHIYTMNQVEPTATIVKNLGLDKRQ